MNAHTAYFADRLDLLREIELIMEDLAAIEARDGVTFDDDWVRVLRVRARVLEQVRALPMHETVQ